VFDFDNSNAILVYLLFVQENGNKKNIAHSEFISTHFIVVQPQKSLTKRKIFEPMAKSKLAKGTKVIQLPILRTFTHCAFCLAAELLR
jgi:hypothetical protein